MAQINKYKMSWDEFERACDNLYRKIDWGKYDCIYSIPKNGLYIAERLATLSGTEIIYNPKLLNDKRLKILIVDDLIDSGKTLEKYKGYDKAVLFVKNNNESKANYYVEKIDKWIQFPFEKEDDMEMNIIRILQYIGEDPNREGLIDTPKRIVKSWQELYAGYNMDPKDIMTTFEDGACDEIVVLKNVNFFSMCEHHNLPFFGKIFLGYLPNKKVIGLSKLARLVEIYARRMQIQEKMTTQIANCLMKYLKPKGVMVLVEAQHLCMISRGIKSQDAVMVTSAVRGCFKKNLNVKSEFLNLIKK